MTLETYIRKLARSNHFQTLYNESKQCSGINLFENNCNFSGIQVIFLYWIRVYNLLYSEMANSSWQYLDYNVIKDDDRTTAFLFWRRKEIEKENRIQKKEQKKSRMKKGSRDFNIYKGNK